MTKAAAAKPPKLYLEISPEHRARLKKYVEQEKQVAGKYLFTPTQVRLASLMLQEAIDRLPI